MVSEDQINSYFEKNIEDIDEGDYKVSFFGTVVNIEDNLILVDNGKKAINVVFSEPIDNSFLKKHVRVYGKVITNEGNILIEGFLIQDMNEISKKLYKRTKQILENEENVLGIK